MRNYAKIFPQFWIGKKIYLITSSHANMLSTYYLPVEFFVREVDISFEGASKALESLCNVHFCSYDKQKEYIWVNNMAHYQISRQLKPNDHRVKSVNELYQNLPNLSFINDFYLKYRDKFHLKSKTKIEGPSKPMKWTHPLI